MSWFIAGFFIISYGLTLGLMLDGLGPVRRDIFYSDIVHTCAVSVSSTTLSAVFYAPAAFELFLFSLTAYSVLKDARLVMAVGVGGSSTPFLTVFYRDGILAFLVMAGLRVWNIWIVSWYIRWRAMLMPYVQYLSECHRVKPEPLF